MANTLVELLQESSVRFPSRPALLFKPSIRYHQWTYAQLWEQSGQTATLLQRCGVTKGDRVVIWGPNCPQWVLAFFGCLRAGAVAVPLDVRSGEEFVDLVVHRTRPALAFVARATPGAERLSPLPLVRFEELEQQIHDLQPPQEVPLCSDDLAEVMFTSGTTGDPKGVMLTHGNILADLEAVSRYIPGNPGYRLMSILPLSHMLEQMGSLFTVIQCGASVTYPTSRQPSLLLRTMQERRVTNMVLVPQALELFWRSIEREAQRQGKQARLERMLNLARRLPFPLRRRLLYPVHQKLGGSLRFVVSGGAALDPELAHKWEALGVKIAQGYGATETAPVISTTTPSDHRPGSVGKPLPGVEVRLAEDGEIQVSGPNVMKGYWEAPEATAAALNDGWYHTGDLGEFDAQGYLWIKGRKKDMIALSNGQNVYPDDIEAALRKHDAVADAAVVGLPKASGPEVHAALLLTDLAAAPEVVAWANGLLAENQQIRGYTVWPEADFPRTHTLKVKKGLVLERLENHTAAAAEVTPAPPSVVGTVQGVPQFIANLKGWDPLLVQPHHTLGGDLDLDSLGRVELLSIIEEEMGVHLDETQVDSTTTVAQLTALAGQPQGQTSSPNFGMWGRQGWCCLLRYVLQQLVVFPGLSLMFRLRVRGRENLQDMTGPVVFAANHTIPLDNGLILKTMPHFWRRRLAIAASDLIWQMPSRRVLIPLLGNGFPFAKQGRIWHSLNTLGRTLDQRWSVLIYPEGQLAFDGPMRPFLSGIGLIAVEGRVPIVPIRVQVNHTGHPADYPVFKRGDVEIRYGKPLTFNSGTTYAQATQAIETAVREL